MAETKKTAKKAETSVEPKKAAPKKTTTTAKKATTAKTAEKKTATAKTAAPKATTAKKTTATKTVKKAAPKAEEVKATEVKATEVKVAKKETKNVGPMLRIKLVKSINGRLEKQIKTVKALGLHKVGSETVKPDNAQTRGMIFVVKHLVSVESVKEN